MGNSVKDLEKGLHSNWSTSNLPSRICSGNYGPRENGTHEEIVHGWTTVKKKIKIIYSLYQASKSHFMP